VTDRPVVELDGVEQREIWARWHAEFDFRPSINMFPGIREPAPSATWSLDTLNDDPGYLKLDRFTVAVEQALATCTPAGKSLLVLDWQHTCYRVRPDLLAGDERPGWPLSPYPDGDYYIYLAEDFSYGSFGHPWEHTVCLFGAGLLAEAGHAVSRVLGRPARCDGRPAKTG
jgi:hypothetical protein